MFFRHSYHRLLRVFVLCFCLVVAAQAEDRTYTVRSGDTLGGIAQQFGVSARDMQLYNDLPSVDRIVEGQVLRIPPGPDVPIRYIVRAGDVLSVIARNHGVRASEIIELNELKNPDALHVGQVLLIPGHARQQRTALPGNLRRQLDQIRIRPGWTHIVIHHSGTRRGNVRDMDRYHREDRRMVNGLGYHFVIGNGMGMRNGEIAMGPRWRAQQDGGHLASAAQNRYSIGICLVGNFEQTRPTAEQLHSLRALVGYLQQRAGIPVSNVTTHKRINVRPTACPGRFFPTEEFLRSLRHGRQALLHLEIQDMTYSSLVGAILSVGPDVNPYLLESSSCAGCCGMPEHLALPPLHGEGGANPEKQHEPSLETASEG